MPRRFSHQRGSVLAEILLGVLILTTVTVAILGLLNAAFVANRVSREQNRLNILVGFAARQYREQYGFPTQSTTGTVVFSNDGIHIYPDPARQGPDVTGPTYRFSAQPVQIDNSVKSFDFSLSAGRIRARQSLSSPIQP